MPQKPKANSVQVAIKAAVDAAKPPHEPPKNMRMRPQDRPFWEAIMVSRTRDEWAATDLILAAQLARCQADIEEQSALLEQEGPVVENQRGTPIPNPRHAVLETLTRRQLAMFRSLALAANVKHISPSAMAGDRVAERIAREVASAVAEEDLLA